MLWDVMRFITVLIVSIFILFASREPMTGNRWRDFSFLQSLALLVWVVAHLLQASAVPTLQMLSIPSCLLYYLLTLRIFHCFPGEPYLQYPRWKTVLDSLLMTVAFVTSLVNDLWDLPHVYGSLSILMIAFIILLTKKRTPQLPANGMVIGIVGFMLMDLAAPLLTRPVLFFIDLFFMLLIALAYVQLRKSMACQEAMDEKDHSYDKLRFLLKDESMIKIMFGLFALQLFVRGDIITIYHLGVVICLVILFVRVVVTRKLNQKLMNEMFINSHNLEQHLSENILQIAVTNENLARVLTSKQKYETLLLVSNEQNIRKVNYETLQELIEELADAWYTEMGGLVYMRISLLSAEKKAYYQLERGQAPVETDEPIHSYVEEFAVTDQWDTPVAPRYVEVFAITKSMEMDERFLEQALIKLLAVTVRGLILRCLQDHQSIELSQMAQEMELAAKMQISLIPRERLVLPELQAKAVYLPVAYVGGDYVDVIEIDERYCCFLLADVSGHGISASLLAAGIRSVWRAIIETCKSPEEILERLNRLMYDDLYQTRSFVTMFIAIYDRERKVMRTSSAGHPYPLYLSETRQMLLPSSGGIGMGLAKEAKYTLDEFEVNEDFTFIIYSDGLTELLRKKSSPGIQQWITHLTKNVLTSDKINKIEAIEQSIKDSTRELQQKDDISVLIIDITVTK